MKKSSLIKKELVKPNKNSEELLKEVEALCGELSCPRLRRLDGQGVDLESDILF